MRLLYANIPAIIFAAMAAYMSANDYSGWGWMIFLSAMSLHTFRSAKE